MDPGVQRHFTHFSMISHGFGTPAIVASMSAILVNIDNDNGSISEKHTMFILEFSE